MTRAADVEKPVTKQWDVWITAQFGLSLEFSQFGRLEVVPERRIRINSTFFLSSKEPLVS